MKTGYDVGLCMEFRRVLFFFQAEDGIRDRLVTGVQTCALLIYTDTSITHVTSSDSNIFEELGFSEQEATKLKIKAQLMCSISEWIKDKELKQEDASHVLQITRPRVSDVMRGKSSKFTIDALIDMLERTGKHVTLQVS